MTRDEADRIDRLINELADQKVETIEAIGKAVKEHQASCLAMHLGPMQTDLKWLVDNAKARKADHERKKKRNRRVYSWLALIVPSIGIISGLLIHFRIL